MTAHPTRLGFHFDVMGEDWWATETAWFSFHHPARRLGGWLYTMVRPNIGIVTGPFNFHQRIFEGWLQSCSSAGR